LNIKDLERELGISLHDAMLRTLTTDLIGRTAELVLDVCVGDPEAPPGPDRERRRRGRLELTDVEYLAVEPPDPRYPYRLPGSVQVDSCDADPALSSRYHMPEGTFAGRLFVTDWNSFIHLSARNATLSWLEPE